MYDYFMYLLSHIALLILSELQFQIVMIQRNPSIPGSASSERSVSLSHTPSAGKGD